MLAVAARASVSVEQSFTLTRESVVLPAASVASYEYPLEAGIELIFTVETAHWRRDPLRIWLLDAPNYERMFQGESFDFLKSGTGLIDREGQIRFAVPETGRYFFVLDNSRSGAERELDVYAYARTEDPGAADDRARRFYQGFYDRLNELIDIDDVEIHVRRCGDVNAFTTGSRVVICRELDDLLNVAATPGVQLFVLLHEISHSLIARWGYRSIYLNQYMVDRLAVTLFAMMEEDDLADHAAEWFATRSDSLQEFVPFETFALTGSRSRRIAGWLRNKRDLDRGWTRRIVVPRMSTSALEAFADAEHLHSRTRQRIRRELSERQELSALR
jgi:hypothetical protein